MVGEDAASDYLMQRRIRLRAKYSENGILNGLARGSSDAFRMAERISSMCSSHFAPQRFMRSIIDLQEQVSA